MARAWWPNSEPLGVCVRVRAALGAVPSNLLSVILVPVVRQVGFGLALGTLLSLATARIIAAFLFDATTLNAWILMAVCAAIAVAAFVAGMLPAARAATTDPSTVMRAV